MSAGRILLLLGCRLASAMGDQCLLFAVPLVVFRATGSVAMSGLAFFIEWLPRIVALPVAGSLADRLGGWRVYVAADLVRALVCLVGAAALAHAPGASFPIAAAVMAVCAFCYAQAFISLEATIPLLVTPDQMPKAQSLLQATDYTASIAGPALAGLLCLWLPPAKLLWGACGVFAVSAAGVWQLRARLVLAAPRTEVRPSSFLRGLGEAGGVLRRRPMLVSLILLTMGVNLVIGLAMATGAAITVERFGQPDSLYASLQGTIGILSVLSFGLVPVLIRSVTVYRIGMASFGLILLGGVAMTFAPNFPCFVVGYALALGPCGLFNVFIRAERLHWIPSDKLGRVISLIVQLNQLPLPLAGLAVVAVGDRIQPQHMFLGVSLLCLLLYLAVRDRLRREAHTARPFEG